MDTRTIRTIYAAYLSVCKTVGAQFVPLPNSTLNQKFGVYENELPMNGEYPNVAYVALGRRGAKISSSTMGQPIPVQVPHTPAHPALYEHVPWIVRRLEDDLSTTQRKKYRMRVPFTGKDGMAYVAYYLKAIDMSDVKPTVELRHVEDGKITSTIFEPEVGGLTPKPVDLSNIDINNPNNDCLIATAKMPVNLDAGDISELLNSFTIMDGDTTGAVISEVALVSGIDRVMQTNMGGTMGSYIECICAQVNVFVHKYAVLDITSTSLDFCFDVGSSELMVV